MSIVAQAHVPPRQGSHLLPVDQGRLARPGVPRRLSSCAFCPSGAYGAERHCAFDCPHFTGLRLSFAQLFDDAHGAMRISVWHQDEKAVSALMLAICIVAWTLNQIRSYSNGWPTGRRVSLPLFFSQRCHQQDPCSLCSTLGIKVIAWQTHGMMRERSRELVSHSHWRAG